MGMGEVVQIGGLAVTSQAGQRRDFAPDYLRLTFEHHKSRSFPEPQPIARDLKTAGTSSG